MKRPCMAAAAFAMGLAFASASMNATAASREEPASGVVAQFNVAVTTVLDRLRAGHASRSPVFPMLAPANGSADFPQFLMAGSGARDPMTMTMACLGLMVMIAYRRRFL